MTGRAYKVMEGLRYATREPNHVLSSDAKHPQQFNCEIKLLSTVVYFVFVTSPQSASPGRSNHGTHITKHESYLE